jgi:uncharacterized protein (TIRG00374 family)
MKSKPKKHADWRYVVLLIVLVLAVYVLAPQLGKFHSSIGAIKDANIALLGLAFCAIMAAVLSAALTYSQLIFKPIPYTRIAAVQYAGMFINRLVPAGVGGISLFIDFLYRQGHSAARSSAVVAMNTAIGLIGHFALIAIIVGIFGFEILPDNELHISKIMPYFVAVLVAVLILVVLLKRTKPLGKISTFFHQLAGTLSLYRVRKLAVSRALVCAMLNTLFHALALTLSMKAFGLDLPIAAALIVLTGGVFAATVTPTPGGIVGAEAGLTAVLMAYGIDSGVALAVALSYRLVSYWLPIIPGVIAFTYIQKRRYI